MAVLNVLGMDPSFSNWGIAAAQMDPVTQHLIMKKVLLTQTKKGPGKICLDDLKRAQALSDQVLSVGKYAHAIFVEVPYGTQSARGAVGNGVCYGILASMRTMSMPFFPVTPHELKKATVGSIAASKDDVIAWAMEKYPDLAWPKRYNKKAGSTIKSRAEHMADAIAAIHTGIKTNEFQQLMAIRR